jgi:hypothetical protein
MLLVKNSATAQIWTLGTATSGAGITFLTVNDGVVYTDNDRASVASISNATSSTCDLNLRSSYTDNWGNTINASTNWSVNDQVAIIQVVGGTVGRHQNATVTGYSGGVVSVSTNSPPPTWTGSGSGVLHAYSCGSADRVMLVKIPQYYDLRIRGAIVTCHTWDGYTGGYLIIQVSNDLDIEDGYFDVSGRGYYSTGQTLGTPGAGGAGGTYNDEQGCIAQNLGCMNGYAGPQVLGTAKNGSSVRNQSSNGGTTSGTHFVSGGTPSTVVP